MSMCGARSESDNRATSRLKGTQGYIKGRGGNFAG